MDRNDPNHGRTAGPRETGVAGVCTAPIPNPQNARNGKIARLPLAVRTELNQRLRNGETGADVLRRLNGLPEVKQVMRDHFAGAELNDANLSRWRDGGYEDWLAEERTREAALGLAHQAAAIDELLADDAHCWAADEEYIRSIGGKLGATLPEEFLRAIKGKEPEEPEKKPCPERLPEPAHHPAAPTR